MLESMGLTPLKTWPQIFRDRIRGRPPKLGEPRLAMSVSEQILNSCSEGNRTDSGKQLVPEEVALPADTKINQRVTAISSAINPLPPPAWLPPCYSSLHLNITAVGPCLIP